MSPTDDRKDFFISYRGADVRWAEWIAHVLEEARLTVVVKAWDFRPGSNFALEMQQATRVAERTIIVLTPRYLDSRFTPPEWAAAFARDPDGKERRLIPVRVEPAELPGLLKQVVYLDLVDLPETEAAARLLAGVAPGRAKPATRPPFPGARPGPHSDPDPNPE